MLTDVAISGDRNVIGKEDEKILKYKVLTIEIQRMWTVIANVIPVIIGATGTISKSKNYSRQPFWALMSTYKRFNINSVTCAMNSN